MTPFARFTLQAAAAGRWTARILGTLMVLFALAFVLGEGLPPVAGMTAREWLYALGVGALFGGLIIAWFWEGWGGLLSLLGWGFLAVLAQRPPWDLPFSVPAAMGLQHMLCWWGLRGPAPPVPANVAAKAGRRMIFAALAVCLTAFLVLCANEVFRQPPLMTGTGEPPAPAIMPSEMVGCWHATLTTVSRQPLPDEIRVAFTISRDGSVSGSVGDATLSNGQLVSNRSWFGRLMKWRTDYLIRGTLSRVVEARGGIAGDRFSAPLNIRGPELSGTLFLSHPGEPKPLGLNLKKR